MPCRVVPREPLHLRLGFQRFQSTPNEVAGTDITAVYKAAIQLGININAMVALIAGLTGKGSLAHQVLALVTDPIVGGAALVEAGLLRKMTLGGRAVYEHDYGYPQHDHLYCQICNRLIEFHSDALEKLRDAVAREHDFQVSSHRMFVTGVCSACRLPRIGRTKNRSSR